MDCSWNHGSWTEITLNSIKYVIRFDLQNGHTLQSIVCWWSDYSSFWSETIPIDDVHEISKQENKCLACGEMKQQILWVITTEPYSISTEPKSITSLKYANFNFAINGTSMMHQVYVVEKDRFGEYHQMYD